MTSAAGEARHSFPFRRRNWILAAAGLATIVIGYVCLSVPPADGFVSLTLAPLLLVSGYCVLIPAAILLNARRAGEAGNGNQRAG